jgi:excisionase family DNA binding protein
VPAAVSERTTRRRRAPTRPDAPPPRRLVDVWEFAEAAGGVSERTVRRWVHDGLLTGYKLAGRGLLRVDLNEIDRVVKRVEPGEVSP